MVHRIIHLAENFPQLAENNCDPRLSVYLPDNLTEMKRDHQKHPCLLICPGGYNMVSQREGEPIGLQFLAAGYNVFILEYSVNPNRFPTQLREVAVCADKVHPSPEGYGEMAEKMAAFLKKLM